MPSLACISPEKLSEVMRPNQPGKIEMANEAPSVLNN